MREMKDGMHHGNEEFVTRETRELSGKRCLDQHFNQTNHFAVLTHRKRFTRHK